MWTKAGPGGFSSAIGGKRRRGLRDSSTTYWPLSWALTGGSGALVERATLAFGLFALSQAVAAYFARDVVRRLSWRGLVYFAARR